MAQIAPPRGADDQTSERVARAEAGTGLIRNRLPSGVVILEVSRNPASLLQALTGNVALQPVRRALEEANLDMSIPSGAMMLVNPDQYRAVQMVVTSWNLKPRHIITSTELEATVKQAIEDLPKRDRVRIKSSRRIPGSELHATEQRVAISVRNTFWEVEDLCAERSWPQSAGTASTTDGACLRKGRNPRRASER